MVVCPVDKCTSTFYWDLKSIKEDFVIDNDLYQAINLGYSFSTDFNITNDGLL